MSNENKKNTKEFDVWADKHGKLTVTEATTELAGDPPYGYARHEWRVDAVDGRDALAKYRQEVNDNKIPSFNPLNVLDEAQQQALIEFRAKKGRNWRSELQSGWMRAAYPGPLQQMRNLLGPEWLANVKESHFSSFTPAGKPAAVELENIDLGEKIDMKTATKQGRVLHLADSRGDGFDFVVLADRTLRAWPDVSVGDAWLTNQAGLKHDDYNPNPCPVRKTDLRELHADERATLTYGVPVQAATEAVKRLPSPPLYGYSINLHERGEFEADVRDPDGKTVFEIQGFDIFEDGFMRHQDDLSGLLRHLKQLSLVPDDADLVPLTVQENTLDALTENDKVRAILEEYDEEAYDEKIGYYPTLEALAEKVRSSKMWSMGEVFVCPLGGEQFVIMKQVAPSSCEMMTVSHSGYHDVLTASEFEQQELVDQLRAYVDPSQPGPVAAPKIEEFIGDVPLETSDEDVFGIEAVATGGSEITRKFSGAYTISEVEACLKDMRLAQKELDKRTAQYLKTQAKERDDSPSP